MALLTARTLHRCFFALGFSGPWNELPYDVLDDQKVNLDVKLTFESYIRGVVADACLSFCLVGFKRAVNRLF